MTIDISKILPGDLVTVEPLEVLEIHPSTVKVKGWGGAAYVAHEAITRHHPAPPPAADLQGRVDDLRDTVAALREALEAIKHQASQDRGRLPGLSGEIIRQIAHDALTGATKDPSEEPGR